MPDIHDFQDRLALFAIDDSIRAALRAFSPIANRVVPEVLGTFYAPLANRPTLLHPSGANPGPAHQEVIHARDAQARHWAVLFAARFDSDYVASARRAGLSHSGIGLEPGWYIASYAGVASRLHAIIAHSFVSRLDPRSAQDKTAAMLRAVNQAMLLDMNLTVVAYLEADRMSQDLRRRGEVEDFPERLRARA